MKPSLSTAVAAPLTVRAAGVEWSFSPIRIRGFGELEQWVRSKLIQLGRDAIKGQSLTPEERDCIMNAAYRHAAMICLMAARPTEVGNEAHRVTTTMLSSVDGVIKIIELSVRKKHPTISDDTIEEIIQDPNVDAGDLVDEILRISGQETFRITELPGPGIAGGPGGLAIPDPLQGVRPNSGTSGRPNAASGKDADH